MVEGGDRHEGEPPGARETGGGSRLAGYIAAALIVGALAALVAVGLSVAGRGGEDGDGTTVAAREQLLPDGGAFPTPEIALTVRSAADRAGCEVRDFPVADRDHDPRLYADLGHRSRPPTSGRHFPVAAQDGAYEVAPPVNQIVHSLEHGRIVVWFARELPRDTRAALKAFFDHDSDKLLLVPDDTDMDYAVAASAWSRDPLPHGTGRLLGCAEASDALYTALEAFKDRHRGRGPELIP